MMEILKYFINKKYSCTSTWHCCVAVNHKDDVSIVDMMEILESLDEKNRKRELTMVCEWS